MTDPDADRWHPTSCPMVDGDCRNAGIQCLGCVWEADQIAPTGYLPRDPAHRHPVVQAAQDARRRARQDAKRSEASQRGKASRRKGQRVERDFAKLTGGQRVPLSGALRGSLSNDVALPDGLKVEVKARADGWRELYRWVLDEVERPDAVVLKADNRPWLVVQTYGAWQASRTIAPVEADLPTRLRAMADELEGR